MNNNKIKQTSMALIAFLLFIGAISSNDLINSKIYISFSIIFGAIGFKLLQQNKQTN